MSEAVNAMFSGIASRYDRANSILSFGIHHLWRARTVRESKVGTGMQVLDCATGTGDLAFAFKRAVGDRGRVVGIDFTAPMIDIAKEKSRRNNTSVEFSTADVLNLPFEDQTFDRTSIAFGIRNVDDPVAGLTEMARVTKRGGCVVVLEFGQPRGVVGVGYRTYSRYIMPTLGAMITGDRKAYEYLPATAARFPSGDNFLALMKQTQRFQSVRQVKLTFGVAWIYVGVVG